MKNKYEIRGEETVIFLNYKGQTLETVIDTEDLEKAMKFPNTWHASYDKYAKTYYVAGAETVNGMPVYWRLHRTIMDTPVGLVVDHRNHDGLFNRKTNLRNVTTQENSKNMNKPERWGVQQRNYNLCNMHKTA
jgi:hypothetical protein